MRKQVITIGRLPPPITGENLCRKQLEEVLLGAGFSVKRYSRSISMGLLLNTAFQVVIMNRQSLLGTVCDYLLMCWFLIRQKKVWFYFHNRSWRRYAWPPIPTIARNLSKGRLKMLVLTREIEASLCEAGYNVSVLNNSGGEMFDGLASCPPPAPTQRLLWMGRPDAEKGFYMALDVFYALRQQDARWCFDIYGTSGANLPCSPGVHYGGFVQGLEKEKAFAKGGIFILPSRYANETQPLSIIEALAAGLPVVASAIGGIPDMLIYGNRKAGVVLSSYQAQDYIKAVKTSLENYPRFL